VTPGDIQMPPEAHAPGDQVHLLSLDGTVMNAQPFTITGVQTGPDGKRYAMFAESASGWPLDQLERAEAPAPTGTVPPVAPPAGAQPVWVQRQVPVPGHRGATEPQWINTQTGERRNTPPAPAALDPQTAPAVTGQLPPDQGDQGDGGGGVPPVAPTGPPPASSANPRDAVRQEVAAKLPNVPAYLQDTIADNLWQARQLGLVDEIEQRLANGATAKELSIALTAEGRGASLEPGGMPELISSVRAFLGIPSQGDPAEFAAWQRAYRARQGQAPPLAPAPPAPPTPPVAPVAPPGEPPVAPTASVAPTTPASRPTTCSAR